MAAPGILLVDKPGGMTSHDVVARARRALGTRKIGHAGTLDPMATGLLVLGVEGATRLLTFMVGLDKTYQASIRLGVATDTDIESLVETELQSDSEVKKVWTLVGFTSTAGTGSQTSAAVTLKRRDGAILRDAAVGNGPIDALFEAINRITGGEVKVVDYRVRAVTQDIDALGEAYVEVDYAGKRYGGRAVSVDIVEASALAYLEVLNRLASRQTRDRLKPTDNVQPDVVPAPPLVPPEVSLAPAVPETAPPPAPPCVVPALPPTSLAEPCPVVDVTRSY